MSGVDAIEIVPFVQMFFFANVNFSKEILVVAFCGATTAGAGVVWSFGGPGLPGLLFIIVIVSSFPFFCHKERLRWAGLSGWSSCSW